MNQSADKKKLILKVATELFSRFGFAKTSLDEIAASARIAKGTIYYHFKDKEELFLEAVEHKAEEFFQVLGARLAELADFEEKLAFFLNFPVHYVSESMPILIEGMKHIPVSYAQRLEDSTRAYRDRMCAQLMEIVQQGRQQGIINPRLDYERFSVMVNDWFLLGSLDFTNLDRSRLIERIERDHELIIQLLLYGIIKRS